MMKFPRWIQYLGRKAFEITNSYNSAGSSPEVMRMFAGSDSRDADGATQMADRQTTAQRTRNEAQNNSVFSGILRTLGNDTIGTGVHLQLQGAPEPCKRIEKRFRRWSRQVHLARMLRNARKSKASDGEVFFRLHLNMKANRDNPLQPMVYETECVGSETYEQTKYHQNGEPVEYEGIRYDADGNPVSYKFFKSHPGASGIQRETVTVPASQVLHYANIERPGQHRGFSETAPALLSFNDMRRYSDSVLKAAHLVAKYGFIFKGVLPPEMYEEANTNPDTKRYEAGYNVKSNPPRRVNSGDDFNAVMLPEGYDATQMKAEQPTATYGDYRKAKINEAARCLSMPLNVALGDSSGYNYASGRLDHLTYHNSIGIERSDIEEFILDPMFELWKQLDAIRHPEDYAAEFDYSWTWDGFESSDPVKEETAVSIALANGTTTRSIEIARKGRDPEAVIAENLKERQQFGGEAPRKNETQESED